MLEKPVVTSRLNSQLIDTEEFFANGELLYRTSIVVDSGGDGPITIEASELDPKKIEQEVVVAESRSRKAIWTARVERYGGLALGGLCGFAAGNTALYSDAGDRIGTAFFSALTIAVPVLFERRGRAWRRENQRALGRITRLNTVIASINKPSEVEA